MPGFVATCGGGPTFGRSLRDARHLRWHKSWCRDNLPPPSTVLIWAADNWPSVMLSARPINTGRFAAQLMGGGVIPAVVTYNIIGPEGQLYNRWQHDQVVGQSPFGWLPDNLVGIPPPSGGPADSVVGPPQAAGGGLTWPPPSVAVIPPPRRYAAAEFVRRRRTSAAASRGARFGGGLTFGQRDSLMWITAAASGAAAHMAPP